LPPLPPPSLHDALPISSAWTDHPRGVVPTERLRAGGRATPESLRHLIGLLGSLVDPTPDPAACPCMASPGDPHEQATASIRSPRSEEHTSELQSPDHLV